METILIHKKASIIGAVLTLFSLLTFYSVSYGNSGSIQPMPESEYVEFLDTAAALIKANYENISTWQGEISNQEDNYYYGGKWGRLFQIDANDPAFRSNSIRRSVSASGKFAVDVRNNKLYTERIPTVKFKALDLDRDFVVKGRYSPIISIVTSDEYLSYEPNHRYSYPTIINGKGAGRMAFRLPVERVKGEQWARVRDPRRYFLADNKKAVWEELYALRNFIANPPNDIPAGKAPQISIATEDMGDHTKTHIKGGFHGSPACANCEDSFVNIIMTLDSSVGLNLVRREVTDETGRTLQTLDITYEKIGHVYVPKTIHFVIFSFSEQNLKFNSWITFTKSILNVPIPAETFTYKNLGLQNGDKFVDEMLGRTFTYQDEDIILDEKKSE